MNALINTGEPANVPPSDEPVSELTLMCLPEDTSDWTRACTYASAVSAFILFVGTFGFFRKPLQFVMSAGREPEPVTVIMEQQAQPPNAETKPEPEPESESADASEAAPSVTVVAAVPTEVAFAVPVVGNTIVGPARLASAPPINNVAVKAAVAAPKIELFTGEGNRSDYPFPPYPLEARKRGMSGRILLLATVDAAGTCSKVEIRESCGHSFLDSYSADWVRRRWVWPPGGTRQYEIPVTFALDRR